MRAHTSALVSLVLGLAAVPGLAAAPASAAPARPIAYAAWDTGADLRTGTLAGVRVAHGRLVLGTPLAARTYDGRHYDRGSWTGPWTTSAFALTQLVASWSATTPGDSWIEVQARGRSASGTTSSWDTLGRWTSGDGFTTRTSVGGQGDDLADVDVDTLTAPGGFTSWQLRVSLMRVAGATTASPAVDTLGAMTSRLPAGDAATSRPGVARGVVLDVPRYSQMAHRGHYPRWGGGGEAWCSPTSTSMVLGYYDALPDPSTWAWVPSGHTDPWVDEAARSTYDAAYEGTGNWPFNTAYAAPLAGHAFVTRLRSLREAEQFIVAGIPLVASISFGSGELSGAPISASNGHLVVIAGFTDTGDVVVNDPAARTRDGVRRTYDRGQFEDAWLPRSGGLVYVITDDAHPLPGGVHTNW
ncbi:C39 family peptidase [Nocardioides sp. LS1]|uniref:C39 family peptidase n=1 Tax=Nocardioides sp. LS1 TaxID=1027620 RepID=UPI000FF980E8|nr:C39 family peptidase [Nocardioides sp. LS1]GCD90736.1 membrane protein [Nocardioides sp. LS1]